MITTHLRAQYCKYIFCPKGVNYAWELLIVGAVGGIVGGIPAVVSRILDTFGNNLRNRAGGRIFVHHPDLCAYGAVVVNPLGVAEAKPDAAGGSGIAELVIGSVGHRAGILFVVGDRVEEIAAAERGGILGVAVADHESPAIFGAYGVIAQLSGGGGFPRGAREHLDGISGGVVHNDDLARAVNRYTVGRIVRVGALNGATVL